MSVVIATYRRPESIIAAVKSVLIQLPSDSELIVVDQTDAYPTGFRARIDAITDEPMVRWIRGGPPSLPAARNFGLATATRDVVVFVDDDVELLPGCLAAHSRAYDDEAVVGASGRVLEPGTDPDQPPRSRLNRPPHLRLGGWVSGSFSALTAGETNALYGCNMSMRRTVALHAGGFDTGFRGNAFREDAELAHRLRQHGRLQFLPDAALIHLRAPTGGCRLPTALETDPVQYRNETRFFLAAYPIWVMPLWLLSLARRYVICGPALREHRVIRSACAMARGVSAELRMGSPLAPSFCPSSLGNSS